jgi:hypothetical protein
MYRATAGVEVATAWDKDSVFHEASNVAIAYGCDNSVNRIAPLFEAIA